MSPAQAGSCLPLVCALDWLVSDGFDTLFFILKASDSLLSLTMVLTLFNSQEYSKLNVYDLNRAHFPSNCNQKQRYKHFQLYMDVITYSSQSYHFLNYILQIILKVFTSLLFMSLELFKVVKIKFLSILENVCFSLGLYVKMLPC